MTLPFTENICQCQKQKSWIFSQNSEKLHTEVRKKGVGAGQKIRGKMFAFHAANPDTITANAYDPLYSARNDL